MRDSLPHLPAPEIVGWETTLRCNMACRHCGSTAGAARSKELTPEQAQELIDQIARLGVRRTVLTGGETLLRPDWQEIVGSLVARGIEVGLLTNGWVLNARLAKALARLTDGRLHVAVSIDGTRRAHDDIRGLPGSFDRALNGAKQVRDAGVPVAVITTVSHANLATLPALGKQLLRELAPYCWQIQITTPFGRAAEHKDLSLTQLEYAQVATFVSRLRRETLGSATQVHPGDCLGYLSSIEGSMRSDRWQGCQAGLHLLGIQSNGNVKGCLSIIDDRFVEGNVVVDGLAKIWRRRGAFAFTRQFDVKKLGGPCQGCDAAETCRGGCSASSISVHGEAGHAPYCLKSVEDLAGRCPKEARGRQLQ